MNLTIALAPALDLRPDEFIAEWNETPEAHDIAEARLDTEGAVQYDTTLAAGALIVLGNVALGVATNALYDLIKQALARRGVRRRTEIRALEQPDGTRLLVVTTEEE